MKDTYPKYRGNTSTPTREEHHQASLYHNLGVGGVDFPAVFKVLRDRKFKGWVVYDLDAPRPGDGSGSIQNNLAANIDYLRNALHVKFPRPPPILIDSLVEPCLTEPNRNWTGGKETEGPSSSELTQTFPPSPNPWTGAPCSPKCDMGDEDLFRMLF